MTRARVDFATKTAAVEGDARITAEIVRRRIDGLDTRLTLRHWLHRIMSSIRGDEEGRG